MDSLVYHRIKTLCAESNITIQKLGEDLGFSRTAIGKWKDSSSPSVESLSKIAKYFNVSLDYLAGLSDIKVTTDMLMQDDDLISIQRARERLDDDDKKRMLQLLKIGFNIAFEETEVDK